MSGTSPRQLREHQVLAFLTFTTRKPLRGGGNQADMTHGGRRKVPSLPERRRGWRRGSSREEEDIHHLNHSRLIRRNPERIPGRTIVRRFQLWKRSNRSGGRRSLVFIEEESPAWLKQPHFPFGHGSLPSSGVGGGGGIQSVPEAYR